MAQKKKHQQQPAKQKIVNVRRMGLVYVGDFPKPKTTAASRRRKR
jgi:hypothetical protein